LINFQFGLPPGFVQRKQDVNAMGDPNMSRHSLPSLRVRALAAYRRHRRRKGAQIIEFAIILPLFLMLVFGIFEYGRAMMVIEILTNAAREGARTAVVSGSTQAQVYTTIDNYLTGSHITGYTRTVSPDPGGAARGSTVTVNVSVPYSSVAWSPIHYITAGKVLHATASMRKE
jgi:Flp pilus assembly protein TadG